MVAFFLYQTRPVNQATLWTILGGQLLLPVGAAIKFEMVPQFDKVSIPNLAALIGCMLVLRRPPRLWYRFGLPEVLLLMLLIGPFITSELNTDPLVYGAIVLPPETHYDAFSAVVAQFIFLIPFFLGRQLLRNSADNEEILRVLVIAGLIYSLPMLFEIRMSPQLHTWVYGYFPRCVCSTDAGRWISARSILRTRAGGGVLCNDDRRCRRSVLANTNQNSAAACRWYHGVLGRDVDPLQKLGVFGLWSGVGSDGAVCQAATASARGHGIRSHCIFLPAASNCRPCSYRDDARCRTIGRRGSCRFPQNSPRSGATALGTRISAASCSAGGDLDEIESTTTETGKDISITDGHWIITLGAYGLFGFVAEFGLLALTVFRAASALRFIKPARDRIYLAALALIVAINMVDLLPNSTLTPWTWLLAGALLGRAEALRSCSLASEFSELRSLEQWIPVSV